MTPPKILIAEDDPQQGALLQGALSSRGYTVDLVTDGFEAVRRLRSGQYQVALLDYHLPDVDGLSAARLLGDMLRSEDRPRLIAITAAPDGLREKQALLRDAPFDAVMSKADGLPALMNAVAQNVAVAADRYAELAVQAHQLNLRLEKARHRRRLRAILAAIPALIMAAGLIVALMWTSASVRIAGNTRSLADQSSAVGASTVALVNAVQDAELSHRSSLLTGSQSSRAAFETDVQHVDQILMSRNPMTSDASPGFGADNGPQDIIAERMRTLIGEVGRQPAVGLSSPDDVSTDMAGQTLTSLREWAASAVMGSQAAVRIGLGAIADKLDYVLAILMIGVAYTLVGGLAAVWRRWRRSNPLNLALRPNAFETDRLVFPKPASANVYAPDRLS